MIGMHVSIAAITAGSSGSRPSRSAKAVDRSPKPPRLPRPPSGWAVRRIVLLASAAPPADPEREVGDVLEAFAADALREFEHRIGDLGVVGDRTAPATEADPFEDVAARVHRLAESFGAGFDVLQSRSHVDVAVGVDADVGDVLAAPRLGDIARTRARPRWRIGPGVGVGGVGRRVGVGLERRDFGVVGCLARSATRSERHERRAMRVPPPRRDGGVSSSSWSEPRQRA